MHQWFQNLAEDAKAVPGQNTRPTTDKIKESSSIFLAVILTRSQVDMYSEAGPGYRGCLGMDVRLFENYAGTRRLSKYETTKSPEQFHLKRQNVKQGLKTIEDPAFEPFGWCLWIRHIVLHENCKILLCSCRAESKPRLRIVRWIKVQLPERIRI